MLIRSTWTLTTKETAVLPRSYGLELVKQLHEKMNLELGKDIIPTITFSGLRGNYSNSRDFISFPIREFYQLSLTGLNTSSSKAIAQLNLSEHLEFLGAKFTIINREDETSSYEQLYTTLVADEPEPNRYLELEFFTPTAFANNQIQLPLPVPNSMFRSWLEKWNHFAPIYLGSGELLSYLSNAIRIKRHRIQTSTFQLPKGYLVGFTGKVTLQILFRVDPLLANVANLLVNYASFAGTGMKTRLGMGQTQLKTKD